MSDPNYGPNGQPPYEQQPPYGQPYGYPPPGYVYYPNDVNGSSILILSLVGMFCCPICSIVGLIMGINGLIAINAGRADPSQRGYVIAGTIISALLVFGLVLYFLAVIYLAATGANTGTGSGIGGHSFTTPSNNVLNGG